MTPDRARRIEDLYARALQLRPDERAAFLSRECSGDEPLRGEVESLIAADNRADSFMESPAIETVSWETAARTQSWIGRRLGHYELGSMLGAGGMGHVYQAKDTRLGRTVAIKILADDFLNDSQAKLRFEREAKTIATLNHPHICVLHDIGHEDGVDFLVMEHLKGVTLAQRLKKGPLPAAEVVKIAVQIADALDKAHRQGVTHRDLKPANVMLTENGAKLLDFGLAKSEQAGAAASETSVDADALTVSGVIVGTPQYMAPEQIEGKRADSRTDVFAFGCVWFEMLTGQKAFVGQTAASLMAEILRGSPPELPPHFSPALRRALAQCWAKDPDERWQSMGDLRREIVWIAEAAPQTEAKPQRSASAIARSLKKRISRREILAWGAAGAASAAAAAVWTRPGNTPTTTEPIRARFSIPEPANLAMNFFQTPPDISPDGRMVAFFANDPRGSIYVRTLDSYEIRALPGTDGARSVFWSPDSRSIAFFSDNKLKQSPVGGGPAQIICDAGGLDTTGGCWNESGLIVFQEGQGGMLRQVAAAGGVSRPILAPQSSDEKTSQQTPCFLPDGKTVLFTQINANPEKSGVYAVTLGSSQPHRILPSVGVVRFVPPGYLLFARDGVLTAQAFDPTTLKVHGDTSVVANDVWGFQDVAGFGVSTTGIIVYRRVVTPTAQLIWFDRQGRPQKRLGQPGPFIHMDLSRDERRAVLEQYENGQGDLWILDLARETTTRLTFGGWALNAHWAPDNNEIVYAQARYGSLKFLRRDAAGGREEELISLPMGPTQPTHWSDDGRYIIYNVSDGSGRSDMKVLPLDGDREPVAYVPTPSPVFQGCLSPDGKWMAYASSESGNQEIYVAPFPNATAKWRISTAGGMQPRWRADGKELFYLADFRDKTLMAVSMTSPDRPAVPVTLFKTSAVNYFFGGRNDYAPSKDGQRFLVNSMTAPGSQSIEVVTGWRRGS
jgi:serine/threonine protein kinase